MSNPDYRVLVGTLTSFGSAADGKRIKKNTFVLQGNSGSGWTTIDSGEYQVHRKQGDVQSVPTDSSGDAVDWTDYMDYQDAGNTAFRASYEINTSGTLTTVTNEAVTMYEIVVYHPGGGKVEDIGDEGPHRETHLHGGDDWMVRISSIEPTSPYPGMAWVIPQGAAAYAGDGSRVYVATDVGIAYTDTFLDASPTWAASNTGLSGDALNVINLVLDPNSSDGTQLKTGYAVTRDGIYKNTNLPGGTWTQVLSPVALVALIGANTDVAICQFTHEIVCPVLDTDYVGFVANKSVTGDFGGHHPGIYYWVYSTDAGANWNANTTNWWKGNAYTDGYDYGDVTVFAFASEKTAGTIYISVVSYTAWATIATEGNWLLTTTDAGATLTVTNRYYNDACKFIKIVHANSSGTAYDDDTRAYWSHTNIGTTDEVRKTTTFPTPAYNNDWSDAGLSVDVNTYTWIFDMCMWNENYIYVLMLTAGIPPSMWYTNDGGVNWSSVNIVTGGEDKIHTALTTLPSNAQFCAVGNAAGVGALRVYATVNGGAAWSAKHNDLNTALSNGSSMRAVVVDIARA